MFKKRKELSVRRESHAVPTTQTGNRRLFCLSLFLCVLVTVGFVSNAWGGVLKCIVLEFKGLFQLVEITKRTEFGSSMSITLESGWGERNGRTYIRFNKETVVFDVVPVGPPIRIYNVYPGRIHFPQIDGRINLDLPIDLFFVMMVDPGEGIGPLPDGAVLEQVSLIGSSGTEYVAEITPINDLANLPTSSANDVEIGWDLSEVAQTTGNFFLSKVTLPNAHELIGRDVPTTSQWGLIAMALLLVTAGAIVIVRRRRRIAA